LVEGEAEAIADIVVMERFTCVAMWPAKCETFNYHIINFVI